MNDVIFVKYKRIAAQTVGQINCSSLAVGHRQHGLALQPRRHDPPIVMKSKMLALTIMATNSSKHRLLFHFGFNPR
jgi:hypothetical protein